MTQKYKNKAKLPVEDTSPEARRAYKVFTADLEQRGLDTVTALETRTHREIILVGSVRIRADKASSMVTYEHRDFVTDSWTTDSSESGLCLLGGRKVLSPHIERACMNALKQIILRDAPSSHSRDIANSTSLLADFHCNRFPSQARLQAAIFARYLWWFLLDKQLSKLCVTFFGMSRASLRTYNYCIKHQGELQRIERETPHLALFVGWYLWMHKLPSEPLGLNIIEQVKHAICKPQEVQQPVGNLKDSLLFVTAQSEGPTGEWGFGVTPAGWRYLAKSSRTTITSITMIMDIFVSKSERLARHLTFLASLPSRPPWTFETSILHSAPNVVYCSDTQRFLRLAATQSIAAKKAKRLRNFMKNDFELARDWLTLCANASVPKNATWESIMRHQREWHEERAAREAAVSAAQREEMDAVKWPSAIDEMVINGVTVKALTTGKDLRQESEAMNHCVQDYAPSCLAGNSRIFRMQMDSERATLEIAPHTMGTWKTVQIRNYGNGECAPALKRVAKDVAKLYSKAASQWTQSQGAL